MYLELNLTDHSRAGFPFQDDMHSVGVTTKLAGQRDVDSAMPSVVNRTDTDIVNEELKLVKVG